MKKLKLLVRNIYCSWCANIIKDDLFRKIGIGEVDIKIGDKDTQVITLNYKNKIIDKEIINLLNKRGIEVLGHI